MDRQRALPTAVVVGALVVLAGAGLFLDGAASGRLLELRDAAGTARGLFLVLLVGALALTGFRFALKGRTRADELAFLAVLACGVNFLVQLTGGLRSPWQSLYVILVGFATLTFPARRVAVLVGIVVGIETANWLVRASGEGGDLLRFVGLLVAAAAGFGLLERAERRRARRAEQELRRLNLGLQQLSEDEETQGASPLSDEGKRLGRVEYVRELDRRLAVLLEVARSATGADGAFLLQRAAQDGQEETFVVRLRAGAAGPAPRDEDGETLVRSGLVAQALREDRPLLVREAERSLPPMPWYPAPPDRRSVLVVPVPHRTRAEWALVLDHAAADHFDAARQRLAVDFAHQVAEWQAALRQLAELDLLSGEFRRLYEASAKLSQALRVEQILQHILGFCREISRFETCAICLVDEGEDSFRVPVAEGYPSRIRGSSFPIEAPTWAAWLLRTGEQPLAIRFQRRTGMPILYPGEKAARDASFLGVPFRAKNRVSGALLLTRRGEPFSPNDVRLLRILCNQAAVAIENALVYERLERMAATDALTGLFNRRYFEQALQREISRAERAGTELALLLLDIDHFKELNDTYGHTMGDLVLKKMAAVLQGALRKGDVLARYGGEEFVILLPESSARGASESAERIRKAVAAASIHPGGPRKKVTVSVGWAIYPEDATEAARLLELADKALYFAKDAGRNRVAGYHLLRAEVEY